MKERVQSNPEMALVKALRPFADSLSELRRNRQAILSANGLSAEQKRQFVLDIDSMMTDMAQQANILIDAAKKK